MFVSWENLRWMEKKIWISLFTFVTDFANKATQQKNSSLWWNTNSIRNWNPNHKIKMKNKNKTKISQPVLSGKPNERRTFTVLVRIASSRQRHSPISSRTRLSLHSGLVVNEKLWLLLQVAGKDCGEPGRRRWTCRSSSNRSSSSSRGLASRNPRIRFQFLGSRPRRVRRFDAFIEFTPTSPIPFSNPTLNSPTNHLPLCQTSPKSNPFFSYFNYYQLRMIFFSIIKKQKKIFNH